MRIFSFRNLRIVVLLALLAMAVVYTGDQKLYSRSWHSPLDVTVFPINPANDPAVDRYLASLKPGHFGAVENFMAREARRYEVIAAPPVRVRPGSTVGAVPPDPPGQAAGPIGALIWSLKMRWWIFRHTPDDLSNKRRIRLFVLFHNPRHEAGIRHSVGLQKGLYALVHAYAGSQYQAQNNIVIAHELLHTLGASDKYGADAQPLYPQGYADPEKSPLHPQTRAEVMAVKIPTSPVQARMPASLRSVLVGKDTAKEINWPAATAPD